MLKGGDHAPSGSRQVAVQIVMDASQTPQRSNLRPRQEQVLRLLVEEYIMTGAPVGSRHLAERYSLGAAASTVRNDLSELEELGMLAHPHTSAGRVPTDQGYRHYVDTIVGERGERSALQGAPRRTRQGAE